MRGAALVLQTILEASGLQFGGLINVQRNQSFAPCLKNKFCIESARGRNVNVSEASAVKHPAHRCRIVNRDVIERDRMGSSAKLLNLVARAIRRGDNERSEWFQRASREIQK